MRKSEKRKRRNVLANLNPLSRCLHDHRPKTTEGRKIYEQIQSRIICHNARMNGHDVLTTPEMAQMFFDVGYTASTDLLPDHMIENMARQLANVRKMKDV